MSKAAYVAMNALLVLLMVGLIPLVSNDYWLLGAYILISFLSLLVHREKKDVLIFTLGLVMMIFFEAIFVSTGVETFARDSLLGLMPIWLPVLWGYGFVAIKRSVLAL